jgi:hypothetical protein
MYSQNNWVQKTFNPKIIVWTSFLINHLIIVKRNVYFVYQLDTFRQKKDLCLVYLTEIGKKELKK